MELFYFTVAWIVSLSGFYVIHKLMVIADKPEK